MSEQSQLWRIGANGLPDTANPVWVFDEGQIDFHHSATFTWDGKVVNFIDESFGLSCPTVTRGVGQTGRMFFVVTATGRKFSEFRLNRSQQPEEVDYCSAHLGSNVVAADGRYLLVNAWYTGGVDVIDFTNPRKPREVAYYDVMGDEWSTYWYEQVGSDTTGPLNIFGTAWSTSRTEEAWSSSPAASSPSSRTSRPTGSALTTRTRRFRT